MRRSGVQQARQITVGTPTFSAVQRIGTTITFNHTNEGGAASVLLVWVCYSDATASNITGVTYNGVSLTNKLDQVMTTPFGSDSQLAVFHLYNPPVGVNSVVVTKGDAFSVTDGGFAMAVVLSGVDAAIYDGGSSTSTATGTSIIGFGNDTLPSSLIMEATCIEVSDTQTDGPNQVRLGATTFDQTVVNLGYTLSYKYARAAYHNATDETVTKSWTNSANSACLVLAFKRA